MKAICIPLMYGYKGSNNCDITLRIEPVFETIIVETSYGERVAELTSGHGLGKILTDLEKGKYA